MDTILEEKRSLHEERDRVELAVVNEILSKKAGHRDKLDSEHRQKVLLDRYMKCSKTLASLYEQSELTTEDGGSKNSSNAFNKFYLSLKEVKEFHSKHADEQVVTLANEFDEIEAFRQIALGLKTKPHHEDLQTKRVGYSSNDADSYEDDDDETEARSPSRDGEIQRLTKGLPSTDLVEFAEPPPAPTTVVTRPERQVEFTDEEGYGRYLDLTKCHEAFLQVIRKEPIKPSYLIFLDQFDRFGNLDRDLKLTTDYKTYAEMLLDYFRSYCKRAKPLFDYNDMENKVRENFSEQWAEKNVPDWFSELDKCKFVTNQMIDLDSYKSCDELMELGLECLKQELQVRGLKCGGTLEERARRLWSVKGKEASEIDDSLRAAPVANKKGKKKTTIEPFTIALIEAKLSMYAEYFNDHRQATIENVQRKQARTAEERNDSDEDISDVEDDDKDQGDVIYNPKNLPMGWDGKPIPYWLYKLHGLNLTFTCEICGNATYKGPKTFQRHFAEWRHAHGMRCLGIPNTAHFANITQIKDAISLWDKLKNEKQKDKFQPLNEEEYEDSQGNVVNKKTYEDLKRQGLL